MFDKKLEDKVNNQLISLGIRANWSFCRITTNAVPKYFFRVIGVEDVPECSGITKEEAIETYLKILKETKIK